ncbi:hypothetical protein DUZ99_17575 [Xylanibacillus composti]|uniref:BtrH N-terminal domain-containing protein n=1 Tax=Xylanibacillus composti TaxID=1572762 RepID=A0A8J4H0M6_9BACL|nr:BtrH N-terminal domain-containing protein [Xylanibacillus composti]MDT9726791.1 hypothetical protein [Xylanibacillus composti]GIQ67226.1 BtrH N-terminal domain-containing protein [Xylanibacillus composti]
MGRQIVKDVPRYYETYVNDCFATAYGALLQHLDLNPQLILADYMSFMFDEESGFIGINFLYRYSASVEFSEEELNSSLAAVYFPATSLYEGNESEEVPVQHADKLIFRMYVHDDPRTAERRLREIIDEGRPVAVFVDLYHMHYHQAYQHEHGLHAVVITGYDEEAEQYYMFDKYLMTNCDFDGAISMNEVRNGRVSDCPMSNPIVGDYHRSIRHLWVEIQGERTFSITDELLASVLMESRRRMLGEVKVHGQTCGFPAMHAFRKYLLQLDLSNMDERTTYLFRSYYCQALKQIARQRRRFAAFISEIPDSLVNGMAKSVCEELNEVSKNWDITANLALKLAASKRLSLIADMVKRLELLEEMERGIVDKIGKPAGVIM